MNFFIWMVVCAFHLTVTDAVCTFPEFLRNTNWTDSDKGTLEFGDTHMTGWDFMSKYGGNTVFQEWECYHNETGSYATLILKCSDTVVFGDSPPTFFRPFLCLRMTPVTQYSYYYYVVANEQVNLFNERINVLLESTVSTITDPQSEVCNFVVADYTANEYHVLIKEGHAADAIQTCPSSFFGVYSYNITDLGSSSTSCGTGDERLDVCTDRQRMTMNYTLCNTPVAYSANGSVFCVVSLISGSYILHTVYNEDDTVDDVNTYRFTCFVSSVDSNGSVTTSQSPKSCTKTQTPDIQPSLTNGTVVGLNLALTPKVLCPLTLDDDTGNTDDPEDSSSTATGAIVGGVVGGVALIAILAILTFLCLRFGILSCTCKRKRHESNQAKDKEKEKAVDGNPKDGIVRDTVDDKNVIIEPDNPTENAPIEETAHSSLSRLSNGKSEKQVMNNEEKAFDKKENDRKQILKSDSSVSLSNEDIPGSFWSRLCGGRVRDKHPKTDSQHTPEELRRKEDAKTESFSGISGGGRIENSLGGASTICAGNNESVETTDIALVEGLMSSRNLSNKPTDITDQKCETVDEVRSISIQQSRDKGLTADGKSGQLIDSHNDDIQVTRIAEAKEQSLYKGQHLNSTGNICADYDAAMTYNSDKDKKSEKKDYFMINKKRSISSRTFDITRDDGGVKAGSVSRQTATVLPITKRSSSEGNIVDKVNLERSALKTRHSFRSVLNLGSVQWNFSYESPYALTLEQKQAAAQRRIQNQNRKKRLQKRKRVREETRIQENAVAFQRWSERKRQETSLKLQEASSAPATSRLYKYKVWTP